MLLKIFPLILVFTICLTLSYSRQIELPTITNKSSISAKLFTANTITQPDFEFKQVYKRTVEKITQDSHSRFSPCKQNKPEVQFDVLDTRQFVGIPSRPNLIFNFDKIRYSQYLLDAFYDYDNGVVYLAFKNRQIVVVTLQQSKYFNASTFINIDGVDEKQSKEQLQIGYFVKVQSNLLFVNNKYVILVKNGKANVLKGYIELLDFQSVIVLEKSYFAVLDQSSGILVYKLDGDKVTHDSTFGPSVLDPQEKQTALKDLTYFPQKQTIILLDFNTGVHTFKVVYPQPSSSSPLTLTKTQKISQVSFCDLLHLQLKNPTLYVSCSKIYKYEISQFPVIDESYLPFPNIKVHDISTTTNLVVFISRNSFALNYVGRNVNYYEDSNLDRLIIVNDTFISASQRGIDIGRVKIIPPYISCKADDEKYLGIQNLLFKTTAECNSQYLKQNNITIDVSQEDTCIYTVSRSVLFWKVGQINRKPFIIIIVVLLVFVAVMIAVWFVKKMKIIRVEKLVDQYSQMNNSESAKGQHNFMEDIDIGGIGSKKHLTDNNQSVENESKDIERSEKSEEVENESKQQEKEKKIE